MLASCAYNPNRQDCPSDPGNWGLNSDEAGLRICAVEGLKRAPRPVKVAVIDTGIDILHPLFAGRLEASIDHPDIIGWDVSSLLVNPKDVIGHGTHVSGIIINVGNSAYGKSNPISILSVKWYSLNATSDMENIERSVAAIQYSLDYGARIINYSGGGQGFSEKEFTLLKKAESLGVLVVAAAGNKGMDLGPGPRHYHYYPAEYHLSNILTVASVNSQGKLLDSSNWGDGVDVAAPGYRIKSSLPEGRYGYMTGTSQATAFVTGLAALLLSQNRNLNARDLKFILEKSVRPKKELEGLVKTDGVIDAQRAINLLKNYPTAESIVSHKPPNGVNAN